MFTVTGVIEPWHAGTMNGNPPAWASSAIWYSVYPLGACGAPIRDADEPGVHHRLGRLNGWLDHIVALGANGLALGPVWASSSHGYDIVDHDAIDPRLGDDADFDELIAWCKARGLRVLLDGVFNHVSSAHPDVVAALRDGPDSPAGRLFRHDPGRPDGLARFEGHDALVEYDHSNPEVIERVASTMARWLRRGADGWRLDAAYRVPRPFWAAVMQRVAAEFPDALTVAEVLHGDYGGFAQASQVDSVTQYELWKAVWSALKDRNPHELAWALERHAIGMTRQAGGFLPWTFVGNHDVTRIASQVGAHDALIAAALLATLPGMPAVYYGDEFAVTGVKEQRVGGDDAIRPALPATPDELMRGTTGGTISSAEMYRQYQLLLGLRRRHMWLQWAHLTVTEKRHQRLIYRVVPSNGDATGQHLDVTLDTSTAHAQIKIRSAVGVEYCL